MEENTVNQNITYAAPKRMLPRSIPVLVLGISSLVGCFCYGIPGLVTGIICLALSTKGQKLYDENPEKYKGYGNLKAGRICGIIGLCLSSLFVIALIVAIASDGGRYMLDDLFDSGYYF